MTEINSNIAIVDVRTARAIDVKRNRHMRGDRMN